MEAAGHKDQNNRNLEELQISEDLIIERNKLLLCHFRVSLSLFFFLSKCEIFVMIIGSNFSMREK